VLLIWDRPTYTFPSNGEANHPEFRRVPAVSECLVSIWDPHLPALSFTHDTIALNPCFQLGSRKAELHLEM
jgi:hypothetical protein